MANKVLALPKSLHPDFAVPGRKPVGPVEIDWSNPLTRGLKAGFVFNGGSNVAQWDIVNGRFATVTNATNFSVNAGRQSLYFNDTTNQKLDLSYLGTFGDTDALSVYGSVYHNSNAIDHALLNISNTALQIWADTETGALRPGLWAGGAYYGTAGSLDGPGWVRWGATVDRTNGSSSTGIAYVNAKEEINTNIGANDWGIFTAISIGNNWSAVGKEANAYFEYVYLWDRILSPEEIRQVDENPYQLLKPANDLYYFTAAAGGATAAITGTATASITESDIVTGGKTIIITLTGDTFKAAGTGPIGSTADTSALIAGIDSAQAEATGWDAVVKAGLGSSDVARTSDTVATITLPAFASYDITAQETITVTVPTDVLVTAAGAITATPTFTVDAVAASVVGSGLLNGKTLNRLRLLG